MIVVGWDIYSIIKHFCQHFLKNFLFQEHFNDLYKRINYNKYLAVNTLRFKCFVFMIFYLKKKTLVNAQHLDPKFLNYNIWHNYGRNTFLIHPMIVWLNYHQKYGHFIYASSTSSIQLFTTFVLCRRALLFTI